MSIGLWIAIGLFVVLDVVVTILVVRRVRAGILKVSGLDLSKIGPVTVAFHERIGNYMQANYSGDLGQLPDALRGLLPVLRDVAREQGLPLDDDLIKVALTASVTKHRIASAGQVREALAQIA